MSYTMDKGIYFDPNNWDVIQDALEKVIQADCLQFGKNESGEDVHFTYYYNRRGSGLLDVLTYQVDGWTRKDRYCPAERTVETTFFDYAEPCRRE